MQSDYMCSVEIQQKSQCTDLYTVEWNIKWKSSYTTQNCSIKSIKYFPFIQQFAFFFMHGMKYKLAGKSVSLHTVAMGRNVYLGFVKRCGYVQLRA